ncbi:type VI secretion system tip protein VgrG [Chitinophaga silvatica]|uniref:Type VI secretion system tip protein VgrG n=1 Tax=Chitinophaga silvatica TaxID=2282649 RepID=A0A3E1Y4B6_9BACT|nr:type VI secretion system tip protein VgrG [Chitinophaga silvatica]RFS19327.1 type VI secretion system tip protein VgrG [Chitinophaga silvatica]
MSNTRTIPNRVAGAAVTFSIRINGKEIPRSYEVYAVTVIKEANRIPQAKVTLIDGTPAKESFAASNDTLFVPGAAIEIFAGHQSQEDCIYKGIVIKHGISIRKNGSSQLQLDCRDSAVLMTLTKNAAVYSDMKDTDIASKIFNKYQLSLNVSKETTYKHPELIQYDSTDWDFLLERMDVNGRLVFVNDGKAVIGVPSFSDDPILTLQYGATILSLNAEMDARTQLTGVTATTWSPADQALLEVQAQTPASIKEPGNFTASQLANVTKNALTLRHGGNLPREELQSWANAAWQKAMLAKITGNVTFDGFAGIKPGDLLQIQGVGDRFNGKHFVSGIRHDISNGGWTTTAQLGMDKAWYAQQIAHNNSTPTSLLPLVHGLQTGIVAQLQKDPLNEDRVLVKIPMVDAVAEGVWARIATLDAGKDSGTFFRPDIDDEVIVGFIANDPRQAVILGMLNSSKKPAPVTAKDENKEKGYYSDSKMKVVFQEGDKSILMETPAGNSVLLSEKDKGITLQDQNGNKLVMNQDGISIQTAKKITLSSSGGDVETAGLNIKHAAKVQFKAEGTAGMELSSSAIAKLKGSIVQIN